MRSADLLKRLIPKPVGRPHTAWPVARLVMASLVLGAFFWMLGAWSESRTLQQALGAGESPPSLLYLTFHPVPEALLARCLILTSCLLTGLVAAWWVQRLRVYHRDLMRVEHRLELALEQADLAIWEYDPRDGRTIARSRCERLFGLPEDPSGQTARLLSTYADHQDYAKAVVMVEACLKGRGHAPYCDYRISGPDGAKPWIRDRCQVVERAGSGEPLRVLRTFQDVSRERHEEEQRLQLTVAAERSQRVDSLGMLAGQIAHDFRNLLCAIVGCAAEAAAEVPRDSAAARAIDGIRSTAARATELCQQLLNYSGTAAAVAHPIEIGSALSEACSMLEMAAGCRGRLDLQPTPGLWVGIDPTQFSQVVLNLVINAAEATGETAGSITVRATACDWHEGLGAGFVLGERLQPGPYCLLQIRDKGCGMDAKAAERVFEPFFSTKAQGRGLGMAAVLGIVRRHGGAVRVDSEPGRGTSVSILLPQVPRPAELPAAPAST